MTISELKRGNEIICRLDTIKHELDHIQTASDTDELAAEVRFRNNQNYTLYFEIPISVRQHVVDIVKGAYLQEQKTLNEELEKL